MAMRVVVLGGGVAGMTAAHELAERGFAVEVHEAKTQPGGKARTLWVDGSGVGGRPDLPGEHGFRFFPSFYRHLPDTLARIPSPRGGSVADHLVQASEYLLAGGPTQQWRFLVRFPHSIADWRDLLHGLYRGRQLGIDDAELAFFLSRLLVLLTSCAERRLAEYEQIDWWQFIDAGNRSAAYQKFLAVGLTRSLVALKAQEASTRTVGDILVQLLLGIYSPLRQFDRVLDGPTSEVWLDPWLLHLRARGVDYHMGSTVKALTMGADGRISGATVEDASGRRELRADCYLLALPVEAVLPLLTDELRAAEPRLAALGQLQVAWMNGLQLFLKRDARVVGGHANYVSTPSALTSISQEQFFRRPLSEYGDGTAHGCLSVDISDWTASGLGGRPLVELGSTEAVFAEVRAQLQGALAPHEARLLDDDNIARWFLDSDIAFPNPSAATNLEPLLINTRDSWKDRPDAVTRIPNLFLAADYVRTHTDLATMEGANEAARRAVNGVLAATRSSRRRCAVWPLREPAIFAPARLLDRALFELGRPHLGLGHAALQAVRAAPVARHTHRRVVPAHAAAQATPGAPEMSSPSAPAPARQSLAASTDQQQHGDGGPQADPRRPPQS